ncbi:Coenzyme F420 hydrogenase/dehydrogenase, beta subunit C-terminal domain [Turicibacter bilis]|uniref:Coenzyme F420 hydrogenase/dehydrogenase, beta subunit C-terminal domain n=1 Tax=Turicibacter bilis TaxID=2735723 RepID=A0ABY5JKA7_9FIRM|nr:Coenzyme F420 hydrogenase/dehydrogenase, beta subunit C-terminal domain [Turicibacter bilis]MBS3200923.1 Coenzyme F420 hydrogenase/dehydrogenase, beta subunit C-terminal domain [Turicibacter bilis]UUF07100.1 Coenzyme F420 hydrogenase/dehydrogenase, beta subunit C-terminal domain [Turicibacter bilis]
MIEIIDKGKCCGCHGCTNICPKSCISMETDQEGFWYPKVDKNLCIDCHLCEKVCPILEVPQKKEVFNLLTYACKNKNNEVRKESSSGGVFSLLCEYVINHEGVVFGASYNAQFEVRHTYVETLGECSQFRSSKYVQSKIGETYKQVRTFLNQGRLVMFSGTPCQIEGLSGYLSKEYPNLIRVDIACHGVPSPMVYKRYLNDLENEYQSKLKSLSFRNKDTGWSSYSFKAEFENGRVKQELGSNNIYMKGFIKDIYLRPSCFECEFKKPHTTADITLGDYWGVSGIHPEFTDEKGISLIFVHSQKGKDIFDKISTNLQVLESDFDYATKCNPSIVRHAPIQPKRQQFFDLLEQGVGLQEAIEKCIKPTLLQRVKGKGYGALIKGKRLVKKVVYK